MSGPHTRELMLVLLGWLVLASPRTGAAPAPSPLSKGRVARLEAIQLGVARNLDLLIKRLETRRQQVLARSAWQAFSPTVGLELGWQRLAPATDAAGREQALDYAGSLGWQAPLGTALGARVQMEQGLDELPDPTSPNHHGILSLSLSQPLLKGGWRAGAALPLREARLQASIQQELFKQELNALIVEIETAYWDLALTEADLAIKTRSRDRARQQYEDTAENIRRGLLAATEIYVVEENVVSFEQQRLRAEEQLRLARRQLAELLTLDPDSPLDAEDELRRPELRLPPRGELVAMGLHASPSLAQQRLRRELAQARLAHSRNQTLPALDLSGSLDLSGDDARYRSAWSRLFTKPSPEARVGLSLAVPLDRGALGAELQQARLEVERQDLELKSQESKIRFAIENGLTSLESSLRLLGLAQQQVKLAELKLAAEGEKYKNGISTLADVVRFQRELDEAMVAYQTTIRAIHVAHAQLLERQGVLFERVGVRLR